MQEIEWEFKEKSIFLQIIGWMIGNLLTHPIFASNNGNTLEIATLTLQSKFAFAAYSLFL